MSTSRKPPNPHSQWRYSHCPQLTQKTLFWGPPVWWRRQSPCLPEASHSDGGNTVLDLGCPKSGGWGGKADFALGEPLSDGEDMSPTGPLAVRMLLKWQAADNWHCWTLPVSCKDRDSPWLQSSSSCATNLLHDHWQVTNFLQTMISSSAQRRLQAHLSKWHEDRPVTRKNRKPAGEPGTPYRND